MKARKNHPAPGQRRVQYSVSITESMRDTLKAMPRGQRSGFVMEALEFYISLQDKRVS